MTVAVGVGSGVGCGVGVGVGITVGVGCGVGVGSGVGTTSPSLSTHPEKIAARSSTVSIMYVNFIFSLPASYMSQAQCTCDDPVSVAKSSLSPDLSGRT
ncbi:MAG TPA: hypothetical protein ENF24_04450 [Methanosarcinales archaeon]|nr:hypothetical protein [Methanosarcinales archaeon]